MSRNKEIEGLLKQHYRRLHLLQEKQAQYGLETPVSILTEIRDIEETILRLENEKRNLTSSPNSTIKDYPERGMSFKQIIMLSALAVMACCILGITGLISWNIFKPDESFSYFVRAQERDTNRNVANANVIIEVAGESPLDGVTDTNGVARIFIPNSHSGKPGRLLIEANGYELYRQEIDINKDILPDTVPLKPMPEVEPIPTNTIVAPTFTPVPTETPTRVLQETSSDISVLSPTPNAVSEASSAEQLSGDYKTFHFEVERCERSGTNVLCYVEVTNQSGDYVLELHAAPLTYASQIYDNSNNVYRARYVWLADQKNGTLVLSGNSVMAKFEFRNVLPDANSIALFQMRGDYGNTGDNFLLEFRDIPIQ